MPCTQLTTDDRKPATVFNQRYLPFGEVRSITELTPITQTDFGYTGQRNYAGFGLMDYNARFYSPSLGRFTQPDTIIPDLTNTQSWNRYSYVNNNPINYNDPTGHWILLAAIIVLAVVDVVWTGVDVYNATQIINDPEASPDEVEAANLQRLLLLQPRQLNQTLEYRCQLMILFG